MSLISKLVAVTKNIALEDSSMNIENTENTIDTVNSADRIDGKVTNIKLDHGFGFIAAADGRDYFFHHSEVLRGSVSFKSLKEGDDVSFYPEDNPDPRQGPKALAVRLEK